MTPPPRQRWIPALLIVSGLAVLLVGLWSSRTRELFEAPSEFGRVRVVERSDGVRELYLGSSVNRQTAMDPSRPGELVLPYTRIMLTGVALVSDTARVLLVGLGGGALPSYLAERRPRVSVDAVDINPVVVRAAREWFGLTEGPRLRVHVADGREFVSQSPEGSWDLVMLDAFSEDGIPRRLATREFVAQVSRVLAPGGVVVTNLHTVPPVYDDMLATWLSVFPHAVEVDVPGHRQRILMARTPGPPGAGATSGEVGATSGEAPATSGEVGATSGEAPAISGEVGATPALTRAELEAAVAAFQARAGPVENLTEDVVEGFRVPRPGRGSILRDASRTGPWSRFAMATVVR
jgi:spermidine synthase